MIFLFLSDHSNRAKLLLVVVTTGSRTSGSSCSSGGSGCSSGGSSGSSRSRSGVGSGIRSIIISDNESDELAWQTTIVGYHYGNKTKQNVFTFGQT